MATTTIAALKLGKLPVRVDVRTLALRATSTRRSCPRHHRNST
jgi:hypothetical protein